MNRRAQEEMVGFALIVVIIAVILLVFLSFSLREDEPDVIKSYEIDNFIQSVLYYTIEDNVDVRDLIRECKNYDENCDILKTELKGILEESWIVEEGSVIKGYNFKIVDGDKEIINLEKGEFTQNYKFREQSDAELTFAVYY
ncbi:hypothetical protein K8R47_01440 [archaeon]|nr:hypothetical protein [archaeon]